MRESKPENFGRCADDRCPGRCPYRDQELMTPEGRGALLYEKRQEGVYAEKLVYVTLQPEEKRMEISRVKAKNVGILLKALGLRQGTAIVACGETLLTPDMPLYPNQHILVRKVMSSG